MARGIDVRDRGSGNTGATNSFRFIGWKLGLLVAVCAITAAYPIVTPFCLFFKGEAELFTKIMIFKKK